MKSFIILSACLFFLVERGGSTVTSTDTSIIPSSLLTEISEKLDRWEEFFGKQLEESLKSNNDAKILPENSESCGFSQEQISSIINKINGTCSKSLVEDLSQLNEKLDHLDKKFESVSKKSEGNPGFGIKNLERKLSKLQFSLDRSLLRSNMVAMRGSNDKAETLKFSSPYGIDEMFMDIASKVDALYEKATAEEIPNFQNPKEVRHLGKSCRMLAGPYKKLLESVDSLQKIVKDMEMNEEKSVGELRNSAMQDIRESLDNILDEIQLLRRKNEKNINENERILRRIDKKLDSELEDDDEDDEKLKKSLKKYMIEQRKILEKTLKKMLKDKDDDDDDDSDDDDTDDDKKKHKSKKRGKSKDDDDDDDDSDDDSDDDDKKKNKNDSDDDDDDDDDDVKCDDSDENGSESCEKEKKKAYSRGEKKSKYDSVDDDDDDDDSDDSDDVSIKIKKKGKKYKIRKDIKELVAEPDDNDKLVADEPVQGGSLWGSFLGVAPPDVPQNSKNIPDVTPQ